MVGVIKYLYSFFIMEYEDVCHCSYVIKLKVAMVQIYPTLECEINVPAGINMPAGKVYENNKHAPWNI